MKGLLYILLPIVAFVAMGNVENRQSLDVRLSPEDVTADSLRAICLSDSGNVYYNSGNYQDAIALETQALDIFKRLFGEYNLDYTKSLNNIALDYCYLGDYRKAVELGKKVVSINRQIVGEDSLDFATSLGNLALYYYYLGDYVNAIEMGEKVVALKKSLGRNVSYALALIQLAGYYSFYGDNSRSISLGEEALDVISELVEGNENIYITVLSNLSIYYGNSGDYVKALSYAEKSVEECRRCFGEDYYDYGVCLHNLSMSFSYLGKYDDAIRVQKQVLDEFGRKRGKKHPDYAIALHSMAQFYYLSGNYDKAIQCCMDALDIQEESVGRNHPNFLNSLSDLALNYIYVGRYDEAIVILSNLMESEVKISGKNSRGYATLLSNLALTYYYMGRYKEAVDVGLEAKSIRENTIGISHPEYLISLKNLAVSCASAGDFIVSEQNALDMSELCGKLIFTTFRDLSSNERRDFWGKYKDLYEILLPRLVYEIKSDSLICAMYDGALLSKGILLNSEMEMRDLLLESGDTAVVSLYEQMRTNRSVIGKQRENLITLAAMDDSVRMAVRQRVDSLERVADRQERELVERSKVFGDYMRNLSINWRDVQNTLGKGEIAIEFLKVPLTDDSTVYAAMTLKRGYDRPHFVELFDKQELTELDQHLYFSTSALYDMVWKPLAKEMENVRTVYFSPAGELHCVAVEYAPVADGEFICDRYDFYRLSSTRQLVVAVESKAVRGGNTAVLYGGLDYDVAPLEIAEDGNLYAGRSKRGIYDFLPVIPADSLIARGVVVSLPATEREVDSIGMLMENSHWDVSTFTGSSGTEASFKALSGQWKNIIHVATHGFYGNNGMGNDGVMPEMLTFGNRYVEDKAMTRSGLLFAGASNAWQMSGTADNGILTAQEVSVLDLRGLDLCVLSACETGLGEISGEGVFGLQRGFKKAGAKTLLISLNRVYDEATGLLMTEFYRNYLSGMPMVESLKSAQQYLRNYERTMATGRDNAAVFIPKSRRQAIGQKKVKPFAAPVYWAQFILVDAL